LPVYSLGGGLAAALVGLGLAVDPESLPGVLAMAAGGVLAYWLAFYAFVLEPGERVLVRGLLSRP
jgi:hypothetical protein